MFSEFRNGRTSSCSTLLTLTLALGWLSLLGMVAAPPESPPSFPDGVRIYDIPWLGCALLGTLVLARSGQYPRVSGAALLAAYVGYIGVALILPILGLILVPQAELAWYLGDLRWIQVLFIALILIFGYAPSDYSRFQLHLSWFLLALMGLNATVLGAQLWLQNVGTVAPAILDLWYPSESSGYGRYGFHINRYAAAATHPSGLALIGGVFLLTGLLSDGERWRLYLITFAGLVFVVASGNRSLIFGLPVMISLIVFVRIALTGRMQRLRWTSIVFALLAISTIAWAALNISFGRMISGDNRLTRPFEVIIGDATFQVVSGRGGERWLQPIRESQDWTPLGTLVNPAHALSELPPFDSMYVFLFAQAGPILLGAYFVLFITLAYYAWRTWQRNRSAGALPIAVVSCFFLVSITQNLITGMTGRVLLTLAVIQLVLAMTHFEASGRRKKAQGSRQSTGGT